MIIDYLKNVKALYSTLQKLQFQNVAYTIF